MREKENEIPYLKETEHGKRKNRVIPCVVVSDRRNFTPRNSYEVVMAERPITGSVLRHRNLCAEIRPGNLEPTEKSGYLCLREWFPKPITLTEVC